MTGERLQLVSFKPMRKNTLVGFATVRLPIGLIVHDCPVNQSHGKAWASLPAKPQIDKDGQAIRKRAKVAYAVVLEWDETRLRDAFSERVCAAVRAQHPDAFAEGGNDG